MNNLDVATNIDSILEIPCHLLSNPEDCMKIITPNFNFRVLSMNIRSISKNFNEFLVYLRRLNITFDVLVLTECRLNDSSIIDNLPGYNTYHTNQNINQNGGVVAYVKDSWNAVVSEPTFNDSCCLVIDIPKVATILGIYRSPSFRNTSNFLSSLDEKLSSFKDKQCLIVIGDINIDLLSPDSEEYLCLYTEHSFDQAITKPTRSNACLDHISIKSDLPAVGIVCESDITDHKIVIAGLGAKSPKNIPTRFRQVIDHNSVAEELSKTDWSVVTEQSETDAAANIFLSILNNAILNNSKTIKLSKSKLVIEPWMTPGLIRCARNRDKLHMKLKSDPQNEILKLTYTRYRNFYKNLIRKVKTEYDKSELQSNMKNSKMLWNKIKKICNIKTKSNNATELTTINNNPIESLNITNKYFASVGHNLANNILKKNNFTEHELALNTKSKESSTSLFLEPTDPNEIITIINSLKIESAPGLDGITPLLLKNTKNIIAEPLAHIFNLSITNGCFPEAWKTSSITPIHKDGPRSCPENYRPISLLSILSKILERIVNNRLVKFIESRNLLSPRQFGFRHYKSTEDAVVLLSDLVSQYLDSGNGCIGVFLDLAKAFDTVSSKILLSKLQQFGIRGIALDWFNSYLSGRKQLVKIGSHKSDTLPVMYGVPQGSILGPTLFLIYMNDIHDLQINAEILCYADDTAIIFKGSDWNKTYENTEKGMVTINEWLSKNLLTLNHKKSKYICFHKTAASKPSTPNFLKIHTCKTVTANKDCDCNSILSVGSIRYLGVIIDQNLNFKDHILSLSKRIRKTASILKKLRNSAETSLLTKVYTAITQSIISYCIPVWGSAAKTTLLHAERAQRCVIKVMLRKPFRYPTQTLYNDAKLLNVRQLFILRLCLSTHKKLINSDLYDLLLKKRVFKIPTTYINTSFGQRFGQYIRAHVYNNILQYSNLIHLSVSEAKIKLKESLLKLDYASTEVIIE